MVSKKPTTRAICTGHVSWIHVHSTLLLITLYRTWRPSALPFDREPADARRKESFWLDMLL
jgi:hypothetical protein